ncbi:tape measure protein [Sphingobacterium zeae]|uniref:tape measure protein n=1 Tax=Sphingobacterium zeae TaxID=1776859 RepID=UPI003607C82F
MRLDWDAYIRDTEFMATIRRIEQRVNDLARNVNNRGRDMEDVFGRLAKVAGGFLSLNAAEGFIQKLIHVRSEFQQLEISFTTMLASKEKADQLTKDLIQFAATTPFGMKEAANAAKQLLAYGSSANTVTSELRMLGDVAAGTSQPIGELVYLYGTLRTQGRAYAVDIRQFAGRGIPIYQELAKVLGVNKNQVNDLVSAGKVGFAEVEQAFKNMTAAGSMFGGLMDAQSKTITGNLERLGDAIDVMFNELGKKSEGTINGIISGAAVIVDNYEKVIDIIGSLIVIYGSYRAALLLTAAVQQVSAAATVGMTAVEMIHYGAIVAKTAALRVLNAVMLASPIVALTALIAASVAVIYSLTQVTDAATVAQDKLNQAQDAGAAKADSEKRSVQQLVEVIKSHTASVEQKKAAYDKLQAQTKGILASFSQEDIAVGKATKTLDEYILKIQQAASARKSFDEFNAMAEKMDELNRKGIDGIGVWTRLGRSLKNTFAPTSQGINFSDWGKALFNGDFASQQIVDQEKKALSTAMETLKKEYNDKWQEIITGQSSANDNNTQVVDKLAEPFKNFNEILKSAKSKADLDSLKKALTEKMEALAPGDKDIAKYKAKLKQLAEVEKQYSLDNKDTTNTDFQRAERYTSMMNDIEKAGESYLRSQMTRDQQEIESVKDKYRTLRMEIDKFNRDPRNKSKIDASSLSSVEQKELAETNIRIQTRYDVDLLDRQKSLYDDYEEYKKQVGEAKAKDRYRNLINLDSSYIQELESKMGELASIDPASRTAAQNEALDGYYKKQIAYYDDIRKKESDRFSEALKSAQSLSDRLFSIEKEYQDKVASLRENGQFTAERDKQLRLEMTQKYSNEIESSEDFQKAMKNIDNAAGSMIASAYRHGKEVVIGLIDGIKGATESQKEELRKIFGKFFDDGAKNADIANFENISQAAKGFADLAKSVTDFAFGLNESMAILDSMVSSAGQLAATIASFSRNDKLKEALASFGPYFSIFGSVVSALSGITKASRESAQRNSKQIRDQLDYQNDRQLKSTEAITKMLERQLELMDKIYGVERLEKYGQTLKEIEDNYKDLNRQLDGRYLMTGNKEKDDILTRLNNGETEKQIRKSFRGDAVGLAKALSVLEHLDRFSKTSSIADLSKDINKAKEDLAKLQYQADLGNVDDYTKKLIDQLQNQIDLYTDTVNKLKEETTGNSFKSILGNLSDLFFNSGLDSADAWSKGFDSVMKNYAIQKFSRDYLEKAAQEWYDLFDNLAEGGITDSERQSLKDAWDKIQKDGQKRVDELGNIIGNDSSSGLNSSVKRDLTEATASELTGLYRSTFDLQKKMFEDGAKRTNLLIQGLEISRNKMAALNAIQTNTADTVKELKAAVSELQSINKSVSTRYS